MCVYFDQLCVDSHLSVLVSGHLHSETLAIRLDCFVKLYSLCLLWYLVLTRIIGAVFLPYMLVLIYVNHQFQRDLPSTN